MAGMVATTIGFLLAFFFPEKMAGLFADDTTLINRTAGALRVSMLAFPFVGAQIVICQFFQSIGKTAIAIFLSLSRQLLFLLPGLALLPLCIGLDGVWWSMPMSDTLATIVAIWMFFVQIKRLKAQHPLKH